MRTSILIAVVLAWAGNAQAQNAAPPPPPMHDSMPFSVPLAGLPGMPGEDVLMFMSSEMGGRGLVKGAPYSATAVSETRQMLADGNRITRSSTMRLYRDGQGRTRQEQASGVVFINDVVAGKRLLLNTERKTARELPVVRVPVPPTPPTPPTAPTAPTAPTSPAASAAPAPPAPPAPPKPPASMTGDEARVWAESMREWGREYSARIRADAIAVERDVNVVVRHGDGPEAITERVEVVRLDGVPGGLPMHPPGFPMMTPPGPGATTALGRRDFDGVSADGTKTTWTIAAGRIGNEKPIEIVSERWYAPELMLVVYSRYADPRSGERIYRLEGIKRGGPSADLFLAPPDYSTRSRAAKPERNERTERK